MATNLLLPIVVENGPEKIPGTVMKLTHTGLMIEVDKITFKVGVFLTIQLQLGEDGPSITERVRSVKHYDKFYRTPLKKSYPDGVTPPQPKKLLEVHFQKLTEANKIAIQKYLIIWRQEQQSVPTQKKIKK